MISELAQDLINKIRTVPELEDRIGLVVGATDSDPQLSKAPLPYGWILYDASAPFNGDGTGHKYRQEIYGFSILVGIEYGGTETDLLTNGYPLLESIAQAVHGQDSVPRADLWDYHGCECITRQTDRLIFRLHFSVVGAHTSNPN